MEAVALGQELGDLPFLPALDEVDGVHGGGIEEVAFLRGDFAHPFLL